MRTKSAYMVVVGVSLLAIWFVIRTSADPTRIKLGDSQAKVLALLGHPQEVNGAPWLIAQGPNPVMNTVNSGQCVREFVYRRSEGGKREQTWYLGFNDSGRVISSYGYRPRPAHAWNLVERVKTPAGDLVSN